MKLSKESNRFTYQSAIKDDFYVLAIDIPFKEQETLMLPLVSKKVKGSLYEKTQEKLLKGRKLNVLKSFNMFLSSASVLFSQVNMLQNGKCTSAPCVDGELTHRDNAYLVQKKIKDSFYLNAMFKGNMDGYYKYLKIWATRSPESSSSNMSIELIVDSCQ